MSNYIGIDASSKSTGICILDDMGRLVKLYTIQPSKKLTEMERLLCIRDALRDILTTYTAVTSGAIEGYSYGSIHKAFTLAEIAGTIKVVLADAGVETLIVAPKQLKKFATGNASASKQDVKDAIAYATSNFDESDSVVLCNIARAFFLSQNTQVRYQREVLLALKKSHTK